MWPCLTLCDLWLPSAYVALEQQLEMLGQRWANICKWVEDQWLHLQQMLTRWQHFNDEQKQFSEWLSEKEEVLARMRLVDLSDISEVIEQVQQLKVRTCSCRIVHPLDGATYTHIRRFLAVSEDIICNMLLHIIRIPDGRVSCRYRNSFTE